MIISLMFFLGACALFFGPIERYGNRRYSDPLCYAMMATPVFFAMVGAGGSNIMDMRDLTSVVAGRKVGKDTDDAK